MDQFGFIFPKPSPPLTLPYTIYALVGFISCRLYNMLCQHLKTHPKLDNLCRLPISTDQNKIYLSMTQQGGRSWVRQFIKQCVLNRRFKSTRYSYTLSMTRLLNLQPPPTHTHAHVNSIRSTRSQPHLIHCLNTFRYFHKTPKIYIKKNIQFKESAIFIYP